jgi:hypothetical protein
VIYVISFVIVLRTILRGKNELQINRSVDG